MPTFHENIREAREALLHEAKECLNTVLRFDRILKENGESVPDIEIPGFKRLEE